MNCRDRVLASLAGEEVYPVPYDLFCNGVYPNLQAGLCKHYGIEPVDHEALMRAIGGHTRWACPPYIGPAPEERMFDDGSGTPLKIYKGLWGTWEMESYFEGLERPLQAAETVREVEDYAWPNPDWFDYGKTHLGPTFAEWSEQEKDYLRVAAHWWMPIFSRVMDLYGMETGLMNMLMRPDLIHATVAKIEEFETQFFTRLASAAKGHADFLRFGDDFASQRDMLVRPELWREFFLPTWKRLFAIAHNHGFKTIMHSCGAVRPILGDLIDAGLDAFETVQVTAAGMDASELKREFGKDLMFYGGVETQAVLSQGTVEDVRREVRRLATIMGKGGKYILTSAHTMMEDIPVENAVAMFEEARVFVPE